MQLPKVASQEDLIKFIQAIGFLPFFRNDIPGFSLEECVDWRYWFPESGDGVWEWKGPVIQQSGCAYGKFFNNKAGFISSQWFPDFANYRRRGYDMDALYDNGFARRSDLELWNILSEKGLLLTGDLKHLASFRQGGGKGFEGSLTRLQMQGYVVTSNFEYKTDKLGRPFGWAIARYDIPERHLTKFSQTVYSRSPEESGRRILSHLLKYAEGDETGALEKLLSKGQVRTG